MKSKRVISESSASRRIVGPIVVFVALAFGTAQWVQSGSDAAAVDPARQALEVSDTAGQFEYFPARYTNQAKQPEEHIQAF